MYFLTADAKIRHTTNGTRSLDDVNLPLVDRRRTGQDHGVNVFLGFFPLEVPDAVEKYLAMASGEQPQIPPPVDSLSGFGLGLRRVYMPMSELGSNRGSRIDSVVNESHVQEAGLRVGDWVVDQRNPNWAADKVERSLTMWVRWGSKKEMEEEGDGRRRRWKKKEMEEEGDGRRRRWKKKETEITSWPRTRTRYNVEGYQWVVTGES